MQRIEDQYTLSDMMPRKFLPGEWQSEDPIDNVSLAEVARLKAFYAACGPLYAVGTVAATPKGGAGASAPALDASAISASQYAGLELFYRMDVSVNLGTLGKQGIIADVGQQLAVLSDKALTGRQKVLQLLMVVNGGAITEQDVLQGLPGVIEATEIACQKIATV